MQIPGSPEEWRGHVSAKVDEHGRRLEEQSADIRQLRAGASETAVAMASLKGEVQGLRGDLREAVRHLAEARRQEIEDLKEALAGYRLTFRDKLLQLAPMLLAAAISLAALIWAVATKV